MNIRPALKTDAQQLAHIARVVFGEGAASRVQSAIEEHAEAGFSLGDDPPSSVGSVYYVLTDDEGLPQGMIGLYQPRWIGRQIAYLGWFFVNPSLQGQGHGKTLFLHARDLARVAGIERILVETADEPVSTLVFYLKCGFQFQARVPNYWETASDLVIMAHEVAPTAAKGTLASTDRPPTPE